MKNKRAGALVLALLAGCAAPPRPEAPARPEEVRGAADGLRVVHEYRPAPTGGEILALGYDCAPKVYYAYCWDGGMIRRGGWRGSAWGYDCWKPRYPRCY